MWGGDRYEVGNDSSSRIHHAIFLSRQIISAENTAGLTNTLPYCQCSRLGHEIIRHSLVLLRSGCTKIFPVIREVFQQIIAVVRIEGHGPSW